MKKTAPIFVSLLLIAVAGLLNGCSNNSPPGTVEAISPKDADALNAERNGNNFPDVKNQHLTANTRFAAGQLAEAHSDPAGAIREYQQALKIDPNHLGSLYRLGILYTLYQSFPQAEVYWRQYIKATGAAAGGYSNLGYTQELAGQPDAAEKSYQQGIARDPNNRPCRINYGLMLARRGQIDLAIAQLKVVLKDPEIHYNLASIDEQLGKKPEAIAEYQKALQLDPQFQDAKIRMAALTD